MTIAMPLVSLLVLDAEPNRVGHTPPREMNVVPLPFIDGTIEELTRWSQGIEFAPSAIDATNTDSETYDEAVVEHVERVRAGDTVARIFDRVAAPRRDLAAVLESGPLGHELKQIHPNREIRFVMSPDRRLMKLSYAPDPLEIIEFKREGDAFVAQQISKPPEISTTYHHGTINQSLFNATQHIGLSDEVAIRLAQIFQCDIDFVLDLRKGDSFSLVLEEKYIDGKFIGYGRILASEFVNQGTRYRAIYYANAHGNAGYFNASGESMRKAFLRAPVEFSRISSNFNPARFHPIRKRVMPHRGIDYAAPAGTPVLAAGDGRVLKATRTGANGNFLVLQHGGDIQTKYLHLSRFAKGLNPGARVRQGQVIGFVGSTGWATAPHLHYEFLVGGVHQNPRTVPLPTSEPIPKAERARFDLNAASMLALLDRRASHDALASSN